MTLRAAILFCFVAMPNGAQATAIFDSLAEITVRTTGPGPVLLILGSASADSDFYSFGNAASNASATATVDASSPPNLGFWEGIVLEAAANGSASSTPNSVASGDARTSGLIYLENQSSTDSFVVEFWVGWKYWSYANIDDPSNESAFGGADLFVESLLLGTMFDRTERSYGFGGGGGSRGIGRLFSVLLEPLAFDEISIRANAFGSAEILPVPEPSSLLLLVGGILAILKSRRGMGN